MHEDPSAILPELFLLAPAVGGLLAGAFLPRRRQWLVGLLAAVACVAGLAATGVALAQPARLVFGDSYAVDIGLGAGRIVVLAATLLVLCLSVETVCGHKRESEYYVLVLLAALGSVALAGASDLMLLFAAYLLASVPLYALASFAKDAPGTEAALKYYLLGAFLGVVMLTGVTILYGAGGGTSYRHLHETLATAPTGVVAVGLVALLAGLLFKAGGVPSHFWIPDVTEGATAPVAALVTTIPKIGGLIALYRLVDQTVAVSSVDWRPLIAVIAVLSMSLGNLAAFFQRSPRRLLAYSTISQVGYILLAVTVAGRSGIALKALLFYLAAYAITNLGAFAVVTELPHARTLADYAGLARRRPWLALTLVVCLLGLVGTPPTSVFFGKLSVFTAAIDGGYTWLAVVAVANTVASLFYYLRWIAPVFARPPSSDPATLAPAGRWSAAGAYTTGAASLALGLASGPALHLAERVLLR